MADGDVVTDVCREAIACDVDHRVILYVGARADPDEVEIAAHDDVKPEARLGTDHDISDDPCRALDVDGRIDLRGVALVRKEHRGGRYTQAMAASIEADGRWGEPQYVVCRPT